MTLLRLWLIIGALLAGALFVACGGDDDGDDGGDGEEPTVTTPVEDGDGDETSGDASDELRELAGEFATKEVKVAYAFSSSSAGSEDEGTMTLYWKPPDSWRMDLSGSFGDAILINRSGTSYLCSAEGGEGQCLKSAGAQNIPFPFLDIFTSPEGLTDLIDTSLGGVDIDSSDRSIAGQDATCYSVSGNIEGESGSAEYCFRDDGVLLLLSAGSEGSGDFSLEATSVEDTVADADLEPPYEIVELNIP